jgi:hypothetical protein
MKLIESDSSLTEICRLIEERVRGVTCLENVNLPVVLLPNFGNLGFPVTPKDPTAYNRRKHIIFVNTSVFPSSPCENAQFAIGHEIGHHAHYIGIATSAPSFRNVHPCLVADCSQRDGVLRWGCEKSGYRSVVKSFATGSRR